MSTATDVCANCGSAIGRLETPHLWRDNVVCTACIGKLSSPPSASVPVQVQARQPEIGYATPISQAMAGVAAAQPAGVTVIQQVTMPVRKWSGGTAAVLSFVIPGAGQMYKGQVLNGLVWFVVVLIGYVAFIIPGLILHVLCVLGAATGDPYK